MKYFIQNCLLKTKKNTILNLNKSVFFFYCQFSLATVRMQSCYSTKRNLDLFLFCSSVKQVLMPNKLFMSSSCRINNKFTFPFANFYSLLFCLNCRRENEKVINNIKAEKANATKSNKFRVLLSKSQKNISFFSFTQSRKDKKEVKSVKSAKSIFCDKSYNCISALPFNFFFSGNCFFPASDYFVTSKSFIATASTPSNSSEMACNNVSCKSNASAYDYDLVVIGGGSAGMACSKESAKFNKKVCLFDFVKPSMNGTSWGFGGTCVNVGCVPKKLMHYASLLGIAMKNDAAKYGWEEDGNDKINNENSHEKQLRVKHNWKTLIQTVQNHVRMLNFSYRNSLRENGIQYINAIAKIRDAHTVEYVLPKDDKKNVKTITADKIVICVGGRPYVPPNFICDENYILTSDDIFSLKDGPGKNILVVGGSYIALECAGFLTEFGYDVTVAVRSVLLRQFDKQCAMKVGKIMEEYGTKFLYNVVPKSFKKLPNKKIEVEFDDGRKVEYDTILYATGRVPDTKNLGLENAGVKVEENGKIKCINEQSNVPNIYALGDCVYGAQELTPVAIKQGELLARRLFGNSDELMQNEFIATTVFTPVEYSTCGLSEEDAISKFGKDNIEVFLSEFTTLEMAAAHREKCLLMRSNEYDTEMSPLCLSKLVCLKNENFNKKQKVKNEDTQNLDESKNYKVIGFHFVGPNAGEIAQGMVIALRLGATKSDFDKCVAIHPTDAESFVGLSVTKSSGMSWVAKGSCGGGKCG